MQPSMEISSWSGQGYEPGRASTLLSGAESGLLGTLDEDDAGSQASDGRDEEARHTHPSDQDQGAASAGAGAAAAAPRSYYQVRFVGEGQGERNPRHSMWSTYFVNRIFISRALWMSLRARAMRVSLPPERRSIYGLRILPPFHWACMAWASFMLLFDLIYTAFWVPLAVGLCTAASEVTIDGVCAQGNLFGGIIYTLNLVLSFQLGVVLEYDAQQVAVADGPTVVWAYVRFGRFVIDVISIVPFVYLIVSIAGENSAESFLNVISLVRLIRLVRILSIAKRVYLNASGSIKMQGTGINIYVGTLVYLMMVLLNLKACVLLLVASWEGLCF
ncbi:hypothetical protein FOA52_001214 [Chlamydomonas sp. UWO 241]|nr:hypothetical protein FOA52_001214 [Chlamydomonas sp. UWO 241]